MHEPGEGGDSHWQWDGDTVRVVLLWLLIAAEAMDGGGSGCIYSYATQMNLNG